MLYRSTDKTEATEIVIIDSQMNYRGKLDTYLNPYAPTSPTHLCYNETRHSAELLFRKMGCSGLISMERSMEGADV